MTQMASNCDAAGFGRNINAPVRTRKESYMEITIRQHLKNRSNSFRAPRSSMTEGAIIVATLLHHRHLAALR